MPVATVAPARRAAYDVLLAEAATRGPFDVTAATAAGFASLRERDRALAYELVVGTIKRRNSLDRVIAAFSSAAAKRVRPEVRESLRLGAFQLLYLDRVPAHAAVFEAVELCKGQGRRTGSFVNAVLRRVAGEGRAELARLSAGDSTEALAVRESHPDWLVALWSAELGRRRGRGAHGRRQPAGRALCAGQPPACHARPGPGRARRRRHHRAAVAGVAGDPPATPDALLIEGGALESSAAFADGLVTPQSRGSQLVALVAAGTLDAGSAGRVADLCAAPGGKASQLAALLPAARIDAVDDDPRRARGVAREPQPSGRGRAGRGRRARRARAGRRPDPARRLRGGPARRALLRPGHAGLASRPALAAPGRSTWLVWPPCRSVCLPAAAALVAPAGASPTRSAP